MTASISLDACTPCAQGEVRIMMRGVRTGVWAQITVRKAPHTDRLCQRCKRKTATHTVTTST